RTQVDECNHMISHLSGCSEDSLTSRVWVLYRLAIKWITIEDKPKEEICGGGDHKAGATVVQKLHVSDRDHQWSSLQFYMVIFPPKVSYKLWNTIGYWRIRARACRPTILYHYDDYDHSECVSLFLLNQVIDP
ncbi:hypothetical protein HAX54_043344, partial [Datura stramonium]|nr:hypothetical protein [Datura stramonium]